jgi:predicted RNase H-like HicB family nuclease
MLLKIILEPGEDSGYVARVPALRGCVSQGSTREEALANVREAIELWLEVEQDKADREAGAADVELVQV